MSAFSKRHPIALLCYFLILLLTVMFIPHPILGLCALLSGFLSCMCLVTQRERKGLWWYLPVMLLIALTNPLFSHNGHTPLFFLNGNAVTLEAIAYGGNMAVMVVGVLLWCKIFCLVLTDEGTLYLLGRCTPKAALVLSMALRYLPLLRRQAGTIHRAQKAMGLYTSSGYLDRLRAGMRVCSALIGWSMEYAVEIGQAMRARGYGTGKRTQYHHFRFGWKDGILTAASGLMLGMMLYAATTQALDFYYYPAISAVSGTGVSLAAYIGFAAFCFFPLMIEWKEWFRWNCYK